MQVLERAIDSLVFDPINARKHPVKNIEAIKGSLTKFGQQKPIVINSKGIVIAGNGTLMAAKALGYKSIKCIVSGLDDLNQMAFALADNRTSELAEWDEDILIKQLAQLELNDFDIDGIGFEDFDILDDKTESDEEESNQYTKKIKAPIYEIKGEKPEVKTLVDLTKSEALIQEIKDADIDEEVKDFLTFAAYRHAVFSYEKIAEYYAHAPKEVQELIENSALVIIDFNKAIENGFVKLAKDLADSYMECSDD